MSAPSDRQVALKTLKRRAERGRLTRQQMWGSLRYLPRSHEPPRTTPFEPLAGETPPASRDAKADVTNP